jgi:2-dehydro-3-deoxygluconokinase
LWQADGGSPAAQAVNHRLAPLVDVLLGNEEDFTACLGFAVPGTPADLSTIDAAAFRAMIADVAAAYENLRVVATTLRTVHSASVNDWGAVAWSPDTGFVEATRRRGLEIMDRGGAATASPPACSRGCSHWATWPPPSSTGRRTERSR